MTVLSRDDGRLSRPIAAEAPVHWHGIVGASPVLLHLIRRIELVSASRSTVLITGETGTGKELVARALHDAGPRRHMPFVAVNCAAIPATLIESELFGHVRGAFTGATSNRKGRFFLANGGTIFLDEISKLCADAQSKLLRVLQEREVDPLGAEHTVPIDVRVVAATNRDLRQLVSSGAFQEDLFYRLNVIPITLPPLRERLDDIPSLVDCMVVRQRKRGGERIRALEAGVIEMLQSHHWPGNIRELENTVERAVTLTPGDTITLDAIAIESSVRRDHARPLPSLRLHDNLQWIECESIRQALHISTTKQHAAMLLGISPRALSYYLAKYRFIDAEPSPRGQSVSWPHRASGTSRDVNISPARVV
jgi:transcriptional regulator with GAF, ATPase, and Fis domain